MSVRWYSVVIDRHDVHSEADRWTTAPNWQRVYEADDEVVVLSPRNR
jgi:hypothetical protein